MKNFCKSVTTTDLVTLYTERRNNFQQELDSIHRRLQLVSWIRVGLALIILTLAYFSFQTPMLGWAAAGVTILYLHFVRKYELLKTKAGLYQNLIRINEQELDALRGNHESIDGGKEFIDPHHPYTADLDIFGDGSIFQRINRTCTEPGKERLAFVLANPLVSREAIIHRQQAVNELSSKVDFRQYFRAIGMRSQEKKQDQQKIIDWLKLPALVYGKSTYRWMMLGLPALSLLTLLYWVLLSNATPFIAVALIQWTIVGTHAKRISLFQDYIGNKRYLIEKFVSHFQLLNDEKFASLTAQKLNQYAHDARLQFEILASRARALDLRLNLLANLLLNSTMLYDILCVYRLERWRERNSEHMQKWFMTIAEADALSSLANFSFNNPDFNFPSIINDPVIMMEDAGHPLVKSDNRVCNTVRMEKGSSVWIVTGANMAGKSTFLRTVGVNIVLALTGSVVCAKEMVCPVTEIYTGMRNTDSINENQSYFFAELLRLQIIMKKLKDGKPLLILLDEILKGTNSADKLTGSEELVKQLVAKPCFLIVATHDIALGELEKQYPSIKNFHFETFLRGDELSFDYLLKPGISTSKNATFLMRQMGIIPKGNH